MVDASSISGILLLFAEGGADLTAAWQVIAGSQPDFKCSPVQSYMTTKMSLLNTD